MLHQLGCSMSLVIVSTVAFPVCCFIVIYCRFLSVSVLHESCDALNCRCSSVQLTNWIFCFAPAQVSSENCFQSGHCSRNFATNVMLHSPSTMTKRAGRRWQGHRAAKRLYSLAAGCADALIQHELLSRLKMLASASVWNASFSNAASTSIADASSTAVPNAASTSIADAASTSHSNASSTSIADASSASVSNTSTSIADASNPNPHKWASTP
jgi:hypothetical protein